MSRAMTMHGRRHAAATTTAPAHRVRRLIRALAAALARAHRRAELRRELERLDDRMLRDIGVSRREVEKEAWRPMWRR